jgi:hypothetical protein
MPYLEAAHCNTRPRASASNFSSASDIEAIAIISLSINGVFLPNVKDEPRPWLARAVLLGARIVTAMVVGSGALLGVWASRHNLHRETVIAITDASPKRDPGFIPAQNVNGKANSGRPNIRPQYLECSATNSASSAITAHEKLSKIDVRLFFSKQSISYRIGLGKEHHTILALQPLPHALRKLRGAHWIPVPFITNELMIPLRK